MKKQIIGVHLKFDESLIKARVTSNFFDLPSTIETFTISISDISNAGGNLNLSWDNKIAIYKIDVLTREKMVKNIMDVMSSNPTLADYRKAAVYFYQENIEIKKALNGLI